MLDIGYEAASAMAAADSNIAHAAYGRLHKLRDDFEKLYERLRSLEMELRSGIGVSSPHEVSLEMEVDDSVISGKLTKASLENVKNPRDLLTGLPLLACQLAVAREGDKLLQALRTSPARRPDQSAKTSKFDACLFTDHANRMELARRILSIVPLCLQPKMGVLGASRIIFPVSTTLRQVSGIEPEYSRCLDFLEQVAEVQGIRFARMVGPLRPDLSSKKTTVTGTKLAMSPLTVG